VAFFFSTTYDLIIEKNCLIKRFQARIDNPKLLFFYLFILSRIEVPLPTEVFFFKFMNSAVDEHHSVSMCGSNSLTARSINTDSREVTLVFSISQSIDLKSYIFNCSFRLVVDGYMNDSYLFLQVCLYLNIKIIFIYIS